MVRQEQEKNLKKLRTSFIYTISSNALPLVDDGCKPEMLYCYKQTITHCFL